MLDRVTLAIDGVLGRDHESLSIEMGCGSIAQNLRAEAMAAAARAAVAAMREPTEAMCKAGEAVIVSHAWSGRGEHISDPETPWEAMIDEALK